MPIDPMTGYMIASGAANFLGNLFGGGGKHMSPEELALAREQLKAQVASQGRAQTHAESDTANTLGRQLETNPLRDQAIYALQGRMGQAPAAFQPRDMFNPSSAGNGPAGPSLGGYDMGAQQQHIAKYRPGAGGVDGSMQRRILSTLGYDKAGGAYNYTNPGSMPGGSAGFPAPPPPQPVSPSTPTLPPGSGQGPGGGYPNGTQMPNGTQTFGNGWTGMGNNAPHGVGRWDPVTKQWVVG